MNIESQRNRSDPLTRSVICSICVSWSLGIAPVAVIADPQHASEPEVARATVSFSDLDLTTPHGISTARKRLVVAAQRLFHRFSDRLRASNNATSAACYRETLADATQRFNTLLAAARAP